MAIVNGQSGTRANGPRPSHAAPNAELVSLNVPRAAEVETQADGAPRAVTVRGRRVTVTDVLDTWRIDDEWWRMEISRLYYRVGLTDGHALTLFRDLVSGDWYEQRYP